MWSRFDRAAADLVLEDAEVTRFVVFYFCDPIVGSVQGARLNEG